MSELFLTVLNMSLTAGYVILLVMLVRLLLKKAPKYIPYALWGVVAFRLIIPFSFESMFSLMPRNTNVAPIPYDIIYQQIPQIDSGIEAVDSFVSRSLPAPTAGTSVNPLQIYTEIGSYIWVLGILALLVHSLVSILVLKNQLKSAQLIEKNIFEAKNLKTPFVLGLINPKIYLPVGLNIEERGYILLHEQTHIYRKDHIIKVFAFLTLSIHWFNPLVWLVFMLMSTDMELACDEQVLKAMSEDIKKPYANSLLSLATARHILNGSPLAFGEGNVKGRIKNVLNYKRPRFWFIVISIIIVISTGIGLIANPKARETDGNNTYLEPITAEWSFDQNMGADFPFLDYASDDIVIFHGYFGLFVYDLNSQQLIRSMDLAPIDCQATQGDNYCDVSVSADGNTVQLHPVSSENMYIYTISDNTLTEAPYQPIGNRFDGLDSIEDVIDFNKTGTKFGNCSYSAARFDNGEFGYLQASEWTIGSLTYVRGDMVFRLFDNTTSIPVVSESEQRELIYSADVDENGHDESIFLDKSQIDNNMPVTLSICNSSGDEIWSKQFSTSHVGWGSLFLCELDGKQYLLDYDPYMGQGYATYKYTLFTLEGGKEKVSHSNTLEFDINGITELNPPKMIAFADEVNELLEKSVLLTSTEGGEYYFGPTLADPFFERYSWLDLAPELYDSNDDLDKKLEKYNEYAMLNHKLYLEKYFPNLSGSSQNNNSNEAAAPAMPGGLPEVYPEYDVLNEPFMNAVLLPDVYWETSNKTNVPKKGAAVSIPSGRLAFAFLPTRPREEKSIFIDEASLKKMISEVNTAKVLSNSTQINWAQADFQDYWLNLYVLSDGNIYNRISLWGPIYYKKDVYVNISVESIGNTPAFENWRIESPAIGQMLIDIWGPKSDLQHFHDVTRIDLRVLNFHDTTKAGNKVTLEGSAAKDMAERMLETSKVVTGYGKCGYNIELTFTFSDGTTELGWLNGDSCPGIALDNGPNIMFDKEITRELYKLLDYGEDFISD